LGIALALSAGLGDALSAGSGDALSAGSGGALSVGVAVAVGFSSRGLGSALGAESTGSSRELS